MCDVPLCENTTPLNALNEHYEIVVNSNDDNSSSDDDSTYGEDIDYVDASSPDVEIRLVVAKSHYSSELSLPDYKAFYVDNDHFKERSSGSTTTHVDFSQYDSFIFDLSINPFPPADRSDFYHEEFADELAPSISTGSYGRVNWGCMDEQMGGDMGAGLYGMKESARNGHKRAVGRSACGVARVNMGERRSREKEGDRGAVGWEWVDRCEADLEKMKEERVKCMQSSRAL
ncbi:hypothetical protein Tco_0862947 [Tanacetum coccineum]